MSVLQRPGREDNSIKFFGSAADYRELRGQIHEAVECVLSSGQVLQGPQVDGLEERIASMCRRRHAVAVGSGTDALYFVLVALGVGVGDEVLVPDVSFIASASAVVRTGAQPVFVDIDSEWGLDLERASAKVTPATRAMIYVHLFGAMGDCSAVERFGTAHGIVIVEDFAQSLGAARANRPAGSCGAAGAVSFDPTKVIGAPGSGGMIVTDEDELAARARRLRFHGRESGSFVEPGCNSQLSTLAAAVLLLKLDRHEIWTERRQAIADRYREGLESLPLSLAATAPGITHVWHKFIILTDERDALARHIAARGVPSRIHYELPLHREPSLKSPQQDLEFPIALDYCRRTLSLPIHSHLSDPDAERVIAAVASYFE